DTTLEHSTGLRLLHGEADWTPGLVIDAYGERGVAAFDGEGADAFWRPRLPAIIKAFADGGYHLSSVINKDGTETLWGTPPAKEASQFEENGVLYEVDVWHGHKTGFFLDQRPNRQLLCKPCGLQILPKLVNA
ncbi:rlmI, partial [Symbiodinium pilosum]